MSEHRAPQPNPNVFQFGAMPMIEYDEAGHPFIQDANGCHYLVATPPQLPPHNNMRDGPNEPLPPAIQAMHAPATFTAASTSAHNIPIDPALIALPDNRDDDLSDGPTIEMMICRAAASKVAGVRRDKGKGKERAIEAPQTKARAGAAASRKCKQMSDDEDEDDTFKRGRPKGAGNYTPTDCSALLTFVEEELPLGIRGWQAVHRRYTRWARLNNRPERVYKSLETKFKQLVKTKKPTGDGFCPPEVKRAHLIDELINERAHTRDISDDKLDGSDGAEIDNNGDAGNFSEGAKPPSSSEQVIHSAIVRRPDPQVQQRASRNAGADLMSKLSDAFDPVAQQARDTNRANRSMQNTHFLTLSQQLCDANVTVENLRAQLNTLQTRVHEAERGRDRAELKLEMLQLQHPPPPPPPPPPPVPSRYRTHRSHRALRSPATQATLQRTNGKSRVVHRYPEGGTFTTWVTDPSESPSDLSDAEKENRDPSSSSQVRYSRTHDRRSRRRLAFDSDDYAICAPLSAFADTATFCASQPPLVDNMAQDGHGDDQVMEHAEDVQQAASDAELD